MSINTIALIGFGEVGQVFGADLPTANRCNLVAWDVKFPDQESEPAQAAARSAVAVSANAEAAACGANLIISAVTAGETVAAARSVTATLASGAYFLDVNSAAPAAKRDAARIIETAGGRYVEAAIMSPISPKRLGCSILLGGPHAGEFKDIAATLGFSNAQCYSETLGQTAAAKLCRSVVIKGLEALLSEGLAAARYYRVEETVLESLDNLHPGADWRELSRYMISRANLHGARRAEEMREAAATIADAGLDPLMSLAAARRHAWIARRLGDAADIHLESALDSLVATPLKERAPC